MRKLDSNNIYLPMPMSIVGTKVKGKENFMAAGWVVRVNAKPPMIGIGIGKNHFTTSGIIENDEFSIAFPHRKMLLKTDYVGIVSGERVDKSEIFDTFYGKLENAPLIREAPLNLECKVMETIEMPTNYFFIAEIIGAWSKDEFLNNGKPSLKKMDLFYLTMPDNKFWSTGEEIGNAWHDGIKLEFFKAIDSLEQYVDY